MHISTYLAVEKRKHKVSNNGLDMHDDGANSTSVSLLFTAPTVLFQPKCGFSQYRKIFRPEMALIVVRRFANSTAR